MHKKFTEAILHRPIHELDFSAEFKAITKEWGLKTLAEILEHKPKNLTKLPGFDARILYELVAFLEQEKLGFYLN
ncbi:MAG: hypothetical protein V4594_21850 [Bacteroidota bacterium]